MRTHFQVFRAAVKLCSGGVANASHARIWIILGPKGAVDHLPQRRIATRPRTICVPPNARHAIADDAVVHVAPALGGEAMAPVQTQRAAAVMLHVVQARVLLLAVAVGGGREKG